MNSGPVFAVVVVTVITAAEFILTLRSDRPLPRSERLGLAFAGAIWVVVVVVMGSRI